ncbi:FxsB family cyclophane-forming radical SAM/SPASM peptide maturase [Nocardia sp. NPDC046763]|uniref:FxsB family cyclophane-forming radical SAM/SPASM peptide maturase n=1 Tax=Nocardia sp. NPDC046763 TaxID=3155256 RepID=UPI0033E0F125
MEQPAGELPWPTWGLDFAEVRRGGWRPLGFHEFVVKVHGRCNLACDYCYIYEMADQSWRSKPKAMSREIFVESCRMIADHAARHALPAIGLVFHGGEPLLVGPTELEHFARTATTIIGANSKVRLGIQTNGVLIDDDVLRVCERWNIRVGVSLDGGEYEHDRHRLDHVGRGSHEKVVAALDRLLAPAYRHLYSGLLCTIDLANDPVRTYEALVRHDPPTVDFLLPHGNWTTPPPGRIPDLTVTPYADWLIPVFDRWYDAPELETRVRLFDTIIQRLFGRPAGSEAIGLEPIRVAVIETDGSLEQVDELKSAFEGAATLAIRGDGNPLEAALWEPAMAARQIGVAALGDTCRACALHTVCGGGHYVHRYRQGAGFRNPSVYCPDLIALITHIENRVREDLGTALDRATT